MAIKLGKALELFGHAETLSAIAHTEFVRTLLWPTVSAVLTGGAGFLGGVPVMWVFMATALTFMAVTQTILRAHELRIGMSPQNKLKFQTVFQCDLAPAEVPSTGKSAAAPPTTGA